MGILKTKMNLEEADLLFRKTTGALEQGSPVKAPLIKTLEKLQPILREEGKKFMEEIKVMVKEYSEDGKPVFNEGYEEKDYFTAINLNKAKEVEVEVHTIRPTENYILPNGQRIRIVDFLEKATNISPQVYLVLTEHYIKN